MSKTRKKLIRTAYKDITVIFTDSGLIIAKLPTLKRGSSKTPPSRYVTKTFTKICPKLTNLKSRLWKITKGYYVNALALYDRGIDILSNVLEKNGENVEAWKTHVHVGIQRLQCSSQSIIISSSLENNTKVNKNENQFLTPSLDRVPGIFDIDDDEDDDIVIIEPKRLFDDDGISKNPKFDVSVNNRPQKRKREKIEENENENEKKRRFGEQNWEDNYMNVFCPAVNYIYSLTRSETFSNNGCNFTNDQKQKILQFKNRMSPQNQKHLEMHIKHQCEEAKRKWGNNKKQKELTPLEKLWKRYHIKSVSNSNENVSKEEKVVFDVYGLLKIKESRNANFEILERVSQKHLLKHGNYYFLTAFGVGQLLGSHKKYNDEYEYFIKNVFSVFFGGNKNVNFRVTEVKKRSTSRKAFEYYSNESIDIKEKNYIYRKRNGFVEEIGNVIGKNVKETVINNDENSIKLLEMALTNLFSDLFVSKTSGWSWKEVLIKICEKTGLKEEFQLEGMEQFRKILYSDDVSWCFREYLELTEEQYEKSTFFFNPNSWSKKAGVSPIPKKFLGKKFKSIFKCLSGIKSFAYDIINDKIHFAQKKYEKVDSVITYIHECEKLLPEIQQFFEENCSNYENCYRETVTIKTRMSKLPMSSSGGLLIHPRSFSYVDNNHNEYQDPFVNVTVKKFDVFIAADGTNKGTYIVDEKKGICGIWLKVINGKNEFVNTKLNHKLLGLTEGKENYELTKHLYEDLIDELLKLEQTFSIIDETGYICQFNMFWGGDAKMLLNLLGLNSAGAHYFCPICNHHRKNDDWFKCCAKRDISNMKIGEDGCVKHPILSKIPISRLKFCALHFKLACLRSFLKWIMKYCLGKDSKDEEITRFLDIKVALTTSIAKSALKDKSVAELKSLCSEIFLGISDRENKETLINKIKLYVKEVQTNFNNYINKFEDVKLTEAKKKDIPLLLRLQKLFKTNKISINFFGYVTSTKITCIGEHWNKIMKILPQIQEVTGISSDKIAVLKELHLVVQVLNTFKPNTVDRNWVIINGIGVMKKYLEKFGVTPFNYCHYLVHLLDDLKDYGSCAMFSCSSIESMNRVIKQIYKNHTNKQDGNLKRKDCILQIIEKMWKRMEALRMLKKKFKENNNDDDCDDMDLGE